MNKRIISKRRRLEDTISFDEGDVIEDKDGRVEQKNIGKKQNKKHRKAKKIENHRKKHRKNNKNPKHQTYKKII